MVAARGASRSFWALLFAGVLGVLQARAGDSWPVPRGPSHEPEPHRYDPAQVRQAPRDFLDDAAACVLYAGITHLVEPDGTLETINHEITRLNSRKGIDKVGEFRNITFEPSYEKLTLNLACIHKPDGRTVAVEPRHVQLRDVGTDYQVYAHEKQLIISFPTLAVGDVIEVKWSVRGKHPEYAGQFFTRYTFGDQLYPVVLDEMRVRLPAGQAFSHGTVGGKVEHKVRTQDGFTTHVWQAHNSPRPPQEENLPSHEELQPAVACSTFASWKEVGQWKRRLRQDCWQCSAEVQRVVDEVTRGLERPADKARALTDWLRRNIRYVSVGEKHEFTPHSPAVVLANRFGDCKDGSQLLAVMLRAAGVPVELATLGALDDGQVLESVPSPWGTHAILLVTIDGKQHWIDTTATLAGWDFLPRDDRDRLCYLVNPEGKIRLLRTPGLSADDNRIEQTTHVWIGADGSSRCERTVVSHGLAALSQRDAFVDVPVGEQRHQVTADLLDANSHTRLLRLRFDEPALHDYDRPVTEHMVFEIDGHFTGSPEREGSISDSKVWGKLLSHNIAYDRQAPVQLHAPFESRHRYIIHVPAAYHLEEAPAEKHTRTRWGFCRRSVKVSEGETVRDIEITFHTRLERTRFVAEDFEEFRKFQEEASSCYRAWLNLKPVEDLDEAPALENLLYWCPEDADSAAILAQMYLKAHQQADARRVLRRACYYRPEVAALGELAVLCAATLQEKEAAERELVRRFPDDPDNTLRLADTLIGQGKQEEARRLLEPLTQKGTPTQRGRAYFQLARSYYRRDELKEALAQLDRAERVKADTAHTVRALHLRGQICEELHRPRDAVRAYVEALEADHDSELTLESLTRLEISLGHRDKALDYLRRYTVVVGDNDAGRLLAAGYYLRLGLDGDALDLAQRCDKVHADKAERLIGLILLRRNDMAGAARHLARAEPSAHVLDGLLRALLATGNLAEASKSLPQAEKRNNTDAGLRRRCATVRRLLERREQLGKELPAPEGKTAQWKQALDSLVCAEHAHAEGRPTAEVEELLKGALSSGLEPGPALALRGRLALEHGKLRQALADAEQAIRKSPKQPGGYYVRGMVRLERGDPKSKEDLEKAEKISAESVSKQEKKLNHE